MCRQLEVLRNSEDGSERGSLLWLLDHTTTPMVRLQAAVQSNRFASGGHRDIQP